jgi:hypothetical protein
MSDEEYAKRDNTYRKYKEGKLKEDPHWTLEKEMCIRRGEAVSIVYAAAVALEVQWDEAASAVSHAQRPSASVLFGWGRGVALRVDGFGCLYVKQSHASHPWHLRPPLLMLPLRAGQPYTAPAQVGPDYLEQEAAALQAGQRCCVEPGERRGEIK